MPLQIRLASAQQERQCVCVWVELAEKWGAASHTAQQATSGQEGPLKRNHCPGGAGAAARAQDARQRPGRLREAVRSSKGISVPDWPVLLLD